jgi:hypothetical protein
MPAERRPEDAEVAHGETGKSAVPGPGAPGGTHRVAAYVESVTGYTGDLTITPGVIQLRVRTVFGSLLRRPFGPPLVHPGPDVTLVHLRWELQPGKRAALLLHKPVERAYLPLSRRRAALLAAELRAAGFDVSEVVVRTHSAATGLLDSMWLQHAVAGGPRQIASRRRASPLEG